MFHTLKIICNGIMSDTLNLVQWQRGEVFSSCCKSVDYQYALFSLTEFGCSIRWHCTKSSDCQVRVRGAPSNVYGVNVTKAVIGAYM